MGHLASTCCNFALHSLQNHTARKLMTSNLSKSYFIKPAGCCVGVLESYQTIAGAECIFACKKEGCRYICDRKGQDSRWELQIFCADNMLWQIYIYIEVFKTQRSHITSWYWNCWHQAIHFCTSSDAPAETPLLLAVSSHAHAVVKRLLEDPFSVPINEQNAKGETAILRCLSGVTRQTAALDATIFKWVHASWYFTLVIMKETCHEWHFTTV